MLVLAIERYSLCFDYLASIEVTFEHLFAGLFGLVCLELMSELVAKPLARE